MLAQQPLAAPALQLPLSSGNLSAAERIYVKEFHFEGNTVFTDAELARVVASYTGREISGEELEEARRAVTMYYIDRGYINSGAVLPEQSIDSGVITLRITEGVLTGMRISGNRWLRDSYIEGRLKRWAGAPLNMNRLKEGLQLLRQDANVSQVNAELKPGTTPGESYLDVRVQDPEPFRAAIQVDNDRPPSVGADEILLLAADRNLTGHSDPLDVTYGIAEGGNFGWKFSDFNNESASYQVPLTVYDTTLRVFGSKSDFGIIELPTNAPAVTSDYYSLGATLRQPFYQTPNDEFAMSVTFERRYSKSVIGGEAFPQPGASNGVNQISALRVAQEWTDRDQDHVLALRSTFSVGLKAFGVTEEDPKRNAEFFAWLGQGQYVQRLFNSPNQLVLRTDFQVSPDPLLSLEQFTLGGPNSVRGYRVNQVVTDDGADVSAEFRLPVLFNHRGEAVLQFAPFFDVGGGWNSAGTSPEPTTIWSAGCGLLFTPNRHVNAQLYWGYAFKNIKTPDNDLQDLGLTFKVTIDAF
jgi:hemolysin activation/secretion protein